MAKQKLYRLAPATVVEPLVNRWSAWANLISPATASLHLLRHQLTILRDYLEDPRLHARLARDPEFAGGPFADIPVSHADQVRELVLETERQLVDNLRFAESIVDYYNWFVDEARGQALDSYYTNLPAEMRGYVELVYDYFNQPSIRFFEGLLYQSKYYDEAIQSLRLFSLRSDHERTFFLSTPRLKNQAEVDWEVAFADPRVDELFRLDLRPQPLQYISELLGIRTGDEPKLLPLLTDECGGPAEPWHGSSPRLKYFGHACVLVESAGISLLTDPVVGSRPEADGLKRFSYDDLPEKIDCVLITHNHQDHFVLETLLRLRPRIECLVVPKSSGHLFGDISLKLLGQQLNFKQVVELDAMESLRLTPDVEIIAVPFLGEHGDLAHSKTAYVVRASNELIMFAADSNCLDRRMYEHVRRALGPVHTVFIGTESVGAPLTWNNGHLFLRTPTREQDQSRRYRGCDAAAALELLDALGAKRVFNYAMGREPWLEHLLGLGLSDDSPQLREGQELVQRARGRGFLAAESLFGQAEIFLDERQAPDSTGKSTAAANAPSAAQTSDTEDQFVF